ncbi:MAG TPA: hypothetical protein VMG60_06095 [Burkholderiaceae bacterium]|nr:hypothetical protein [Burkholderiaceae bacterium]
MSMVNPAIIVSWSQPERRTYTIAADPRVLRHASVQFVNAGLPRGQLRRFLRAQAE